MPIEPGTPLPELKACPCGEKPKHGYQGSIDDEEGYGFVECHRNGLSVVVHAATEAEAITAWNARATDPELLALVREAREALEELASAEKDYRLAHDLHGGGHMTTGRAWDRMRRAGDKATALLTRLDALLAGEG